MTTASDIILKAQRTAGVVGVGQAAAAEDNSDALNTLNWMMYQWQRKRWMVFHLVDLAFLSTGVQTYSVGPTGNFVISQRPERLEKAYFRQIQAAQPNNVDYPLEILESMEDYSTIQLKTLKTFPGWVFYDPGSPSGLTSNGTLYPWPIPTAALYEIHIIVKDVLQTFPTLATAINLPPEYLAALHYNLALRLRTEYQIPPPMPDYLPSLARDSREVLKGANMAIPRLTIPSELLRPGVYNPYSDQVR